MMKESRKRRHSPERVGGRRREDGREGRHGERALGRSEDGSSRKRRRTEDLREGEGRKSERRRRESRSRSRSPRRTRSWRVRSRSRSRSPINPKRKSTTEKNHRHSSNMNDDCVELGPLGSIYDYTYTGEISEGAFGVVFKGQNKAGQTVAIKKLKVSNNHFHSTHTREIQNLRALDHKNIIRLLEIATNKTHDKFLVFEYCPVDLKTVISEISCIGLPVVKRIVRDLFDGLKYVHSKGIIHRDIKPDNVLIDQEGNVKIADLGSSRLLRKEHSYTPGMVTLRYRAPEIFLGSTSYGPEIDMWSCACLMTELILGKALLDGTSELEQIDRMCSVLGSPTPDNWPDLLSLPNAKSLCFPQQPHNLLKKHVPNLTESAYHLLEKLFSYNPGSRLSALEAFEHQFFEEEPLPAKNALLSLDFVESSPLNCKL